MYAEMKWGNLLPFLGIGPLVYCAETPCGNCVDAVVFGQDPTSANHLGGNECSYTCPSGWHYASGVVTATCDPGLGTWSYTQHLPMRCADAGQSCCMYLQCGFISSAHIAAITGSTVGPKVIFDVLTSLPLQVDIICQHTDPATQT